MRDRGRQSGGASNQWPACFMEVCVCVRFVHIEGMRNCGRAFVCVWLSVRLCAEPAA